MRGSPLSTLEGGCNEHFRRTVFQTQQRTILLSPDADPVHSVQLSGEQCRAKGELLAVYENHRGELWVLSKRSTGGHQCAGRAGIHSAGQTIPEST